MTFPGTRSRLLWSASWAAAGSGLLLLLSGCGSPEATSPTPSPSPPASPSPSASPIPTGQEAAVPAQVLAPASDMPVANLCTAPITVSADGNAAPLLCRSGAINVQAWKFYAGVSGSVLGLGLNPTEGQVESAICDDFNHNHATKPEEVSGYKLASTYYSWNFNVDATKVSCQ